MSCAQQHKLLAVALNDHQGRAGVQSAAVVSILIIFQLACPKTAHFRMLSSTCISFEDTRVLCENLAVKEVAGFAMSMSNFNPERF